MRADPTLPEGFPLRSLGDTDGPGILVAALVIFEVNFMSSAPGKFPLELTLDIDNKAL